MKKTFIVNLNLHENPRRGFLRWGLLNNPFHLGNLALISYSREKDIIQHLRDGVTLEQAKCLLKEILTEEAIKVILDGMKEGERRYITVSGKDKGGEVLRRNITKEQQEKTPSPSAG